MVRNQPVAKIESFGDDTTVSIDARVSNPLSPVGMSDLNPIIYHYTVSFNTCEKTIHYFGIHTSFPWHELNISGLDEQYQWRYVPKEGLSPFDLF